MKMHSDNIKATAGVLAIHNLNVFPSSGGSMDYTVPWQDSFREACRRAAILAAEAAADLAEDSFGDDKATLLELSIPRFEVLGEGRYRLTGGLFLWAGHLFSPGATFRVLGNDFAIETPDLIQVATAVPVTMTEAKYDTYNASALSEISDDVLRELDLDLDKSTLPGPDDEVDIDDPDWMQMVKYISIYAESLTGGEPGRVIAFEPTYADDKYRSYATPELGFDASVFRELKDSWKACYDRYLVEFVDTKQPFAYITVELIGKAAVAADPTKASEDFPAFDAFGAAFDATSRDEYLTHDPAEIVETLRKIGAGEA